MALFDPNKMKIGKLVKKQFMGGDVYILPGLNALQGIQYHFDVKAIDAEQDDFSLRLSAATVRARVANAEGVLLFEGISVDDLAAEYDSKAINDLYALVLEVTGDPFAVGDAEKN